MQLSEKLLSNYNLLKVKKVDLPNKETKGYYRRNKKHPNGIVLLNENVDYYVQNGILAEEIGHHETTYGKILGAYTNDSQNHINDLKQELKARRYGHDLAVPLQKLIDCYEQGVWGHLYDMCLSMGIDRSYFSEVIEDYKVRYGPFVEHNGYVINFEPLDIEKII